ncbi:MAG: HupE/UreJ family protein [Acidimicrobiales bacterium]
MTISTVSRRVATTATLSAAVLLATAGPVAAHPEDEARMGGGLNGFLHPLLGLDHLAAMVAVGVVAALALRRLPVWSVPASFVGGMIAGGAVGFAGIEVAGVEAIIAGSVLVLGLIVAAAVRAPLGAWLLPAVAIAGAAHGNAHGLEAPTAAAPLLYVVGFVLATVLLHAAGAAIGLVLRRVEIGQVVGGLAVAAFGVTLLAAA